MSRILPDRCYAGIDEASISHTEEHLRRALRLRVPAFVDTVNRYVGRMSACRPSRRCNLSACPSCEDARQDRFCAEVIAQWTAHHGQPILSGDVLLEPRDRLQTNDHNPVKDMRLFRDVLRRAFPRAEGSGLYLLGRYEIAVKRRGATAYLDQFAPGDRSRAVIPHFHFVLIAWEGGRYQDAAAIRARFVPCFPARRQIMIKGLTPSQPTQEAIDARVRYIFKKRTSEFTGRVLRDFIHSQVWFRQDKMDAEIPARCSPKCRSRRISRAPKV